MQTNDSEFTSIVRDAGIEPKNVSKERYEEIIRLAELRLQAQLSTALSADQRALALTGILVTFSLANLGGLITAYSDKSWVLFVALLFLLAYFSLASFIAIKAAWPVEFIFPGNEPNEWNTKEDLSGPWSVALSEQCNIYDEAIAENNLVMASNAKHVKWSVTLLVASPLAALLLLAVFSYVDPFIFSDHWAVSEVEAGSEASE